MGANAFVKTVEDYSAQAAYEKLVAQAEYDDGHDSYNGTISTCSLGRVTKYSDVCTPAVEKKAYKYIQGLDYGSKWVASVLDLGVVGYDLLAVKKESPKNGSPARYQQKYVVYKRSGFDDEKYAEAFDKKPDADTYATKKTLENPDVRYCVKKQPVIVNKGTDLVSDFRLEKKRLKSRPKSVKKGAVLKEVHKYVFYGWAAS